MASSESGEGENLESFFIPWDVPVEWFQVERDLYRPKPTQTSPLATTVIGSRLSLDWALVLTQAPAEARVTLEHRTPGIPNLGLTYDLFLLRAGSSAADRLSPYLRRELAKTTEADLGQRRLAARFLPRNLVLDRYLQPGNRLKLRAELTIDANVFTPLHVCNEMLKLTGLAPSGPLGPALWAQALAGEGTDVEFQCGDGGLVRAHMALLSAFCPALRRTFAARRNAFKWEIQTGDLGSPVIREALHYLYFRGVSEDLACIPLNEALEAGRLFGLGSGWRLQVERLLTSLPLTPENLTRLWRLSEAYELPVVRNLVVTAVAVDSRHLRAMEDPRVRNAITAATPTSRLHPNRALAA